jgi:hypothetical protein
VLVAVGGLVAAAARVGALVGLDRLVGVGGAAAPAS